MELVVSSEFNSINFEDKQNFLEKIYNKLGELVIEKAVINKISLDTRQLVYSKSIILQIGPKIYEFKYDGLKVTDTSTSADKKQLGEKILTDEQIVSKIQDNIRENRFVEELRQDIQPGTTYIYGPYNQQISLTMKDDYFLKKISEQYIELSNIFEQYLDTLRECGVKPFYNSIYVGKKGNDYKT